MQKIKASAMQFAILVSVIVALLLSSFLLFTYTHTIFSSQSDQVLKNIHVSNLGINYLSNREIGIVDSLNIIIEDIPVVLNTSFWGSYEYVKSKAGSKTNSFQKVAFLGAGNQEEKISLYLENNQLPLVIVGQTKIEGDAYLPENLVKQGSIGGHYYVGEQMIYGRRFSSKTKLPALQTEWRQYIEETLDSIPLTGNNISPLERKTNSFFNKPEIIYQTNKIDIIESLKGNILIKSEREINVSKIAILSEVLLVAPKVVVRRGFTGNIHIIAEEVIIEEDVYLTYPSSVVVLEKNRINEELLFEPKIQIGKNTVVQGNLVYLVRTEDGKSKNHMLIEESAMVEGNIYSEGYTDLKGTVIGSVYTRFFASASHGSLYINHIYNGKILTAEVKEEIAGLPLVANSKKVALWLY